MINDKDKIKMFEMRVKGATLQEIGDKFGLTRERVRQILKSTISRETSMIRGREGIIYPNISKWLKDNDISIGEFTEMLGKNKETPKSVCRISHILKGKTKQGFTMPEIRMVLEVTGMTFEKAFEECKER